MTDERIPQTNRVTRRIRAPKEAATFDVLPGENIARALARIRAAGWSGPVCLSLALVA